MDTFPLNPPLDLEKNECVIAATNSGTYYSVTKNAEENDNFTFFAEVF